LNWFSVGKSCLIHTSGEALHTVNVKALNKNLVSTCISATG